MLAAGRFIALEGGEGAGKSTQARRLADFLRAQGRQVHVTREVGGAPLAEEIRKLWLADRAEAWDPLTELLLIFAARREHLVKTVWPLLAAGSWVISDRFMASTLVYQGIVMGLGRAQVEALYAMVAGTFAPDLTLLLDLPVAAARARIAARSLDRYERQDDAFHEQLRQGFLGLAAEQPQNWRVIDAALPPDDVAAAMADAVQGLAA